MAKSVFGESEIQGSWSTALVCNSPPIAVS
jgi:hypothetical protein